MKKQLIKVLSVPFICLIFITSLSLSAFAYSFPPSEVVDFTIPSFDGTPIHYSSLSSQYDFCVQLFTVDRSGHPYYWEFYFDNIAFSVGFLYTRYSSQSSQFFLRFTNDLSSTQIIHFRYFVFDGVTGSQIWDRDFLYNWNGSSFSAVTSLSVSGGTYKDLFVLPSSSSYLLGYSSQYCNLFNFRTSDAGYLMPAPNTSYYSWEPFSFYINGRVPDFNGSGGSGSGGSTSGSSSGTASGSYDSETGDINVDVNLEQDYSPLIDYGDSEDVPSISDSSADEFESAVSDLPSIHDDDLDTVFENYDFDQNNNSISWIYSLINTVFRGNEKVFSLLLSFLLLSLIMLILNKRG